MTPAGIAGAADGRAAAVAAGAALVLCGAANPGDAAPRDAKQKANIRAFSKIFSAPAQFHPVQSGTGTAGELCKYVARGRCDRFVAPNHSTIVT